MKKRIQFHQENVKKLQDTQSRLHEDFQKWIHSLTVTKEPLMAGLTYNPRYSSDHEVDYSVYVHNFKKPGRSFECNVEELDALIDVLQEFRSKVNEA